LKPFERVQTSFKPFELSGDFKPFVPMNFASNTNQPKIKLNHQALKQSQKRLSVIKERSEWSS
jgi:hypothetical protein